MSKYRVYFGTYLSAAVTVEATDEDEAVDKAYDELPSGLCAKCEAPYGRPYYLDVTGEWEDSCVIEVRE